jgi:CCR4-NOT transcription complex subunit 3
MELFKAVERETKVKAYSREGLSRDAPMSAEERKRLKSREWVQDAAHQLSDTLEQVETELENIENPKTKREKEVVAHLETVIKNHRWHIDRLDGVIRLLDNAAVEADDVDQIKDNIDDYLERGKDEDYEMDLELYNGFEGLTIGDDTDTDFPTTDDEEAKKASAGAGTAKRESDNDTKAPSTAAAPVAAPAPAPVKATPPASTVTKPTTTTQPAITATKVPMTTDTSAGRGRGIGIADSKPSVTMAPALPATKTTVGTVAVTGVASTTTAAGRGRGNIVPAVVPGNPPLARSISAPNAANAPAPLPATSAVSATSVAAASSSKTGDSLANILRGKTTPSASTPTTTGATPHPPPAATVTYASITGTSQPVEAKPAATVPTFTIDPATAAAQLSTALSTASVLAPAPAILDNAHVMLPLASQRFNLAALQLRYVPPVTTQSQEL